MPVRPHDPTDFGLLLRRLRAVANLSQEELATRSRLSVRAVSDLERGVNLRPRPHTLRQLADALQLSEHERALLGAAARPTAQQRRPLESQRPPGVANFLGARPLMPLAARLRECASIRETLEAVFEGVGRMLLFAGEPGVGKTRLGQEAVIEAEARGFLVAVGRCHQAAEGVPFYPFLETLTSLVSESPRAIQTRIAERWPYMEAFLAFPGRPDAANQLPRSEADDLEQEQPFFRSVTDFLKAVAAERPVALVIDDLHWGDGASLRLFLYIARFTRGDRILLLGTYRDAAADRSPHLDQVLHALRHDQLGETLRLQQLDRNGTRSLLEAALGDAVSDGVLDLLYRTTAGNPFFVYEVLESLQESGRLMLRDGQWMLAAGAEIDIPESVRSAVLLRLARLRPEAQDVLSEASVLGGELPFDQLVALSGRSEGAVERALEDAVSLGVLNAESADEYTFSHPLVPQTLYATLSPRRKRRLHLAAAAAAERAPTFRAAQVFRHLLAGNDRAGAVHWGLRAGEEASRVFAYEEAAGYFRQAAALARELGEYADERQCLENLGAALRAAGRPHEALEVLERAAAFYRTAGDLDGEARAVAYVGEIHRRWGSPREGIARIQSILPELEQGGYATIVAVLHVTLARLLFATGNGRASLAHAERAAELARALDHPVILARAEVRRGTALLALGQTREALATLNAAVRLAEEANEEDTLSEGLNNLAAAYYDSGNLRRSGECAERMAAMQDRFGAACGTPWAELARGDRAYTDGQWKQALQHYTRAMDLYGEIVSSHFAPYAWADAGTLLLQTGHREEGLHHLDEALSAMSENGDSFGVRQVQIALAEHDLFEGRPECALERLEPCVDGAAEDTSDLLPALTDAHLARGDIERAEQLVDAGIRRAREHDQVMSLALLLRVHGAVMAGRQQFDEAAGSFAEALALLEPMPFPWETGRTLYRCGVMESTRGDSRRAGSYLDQAIAIFRRLGARPYAERTREALAETQDGHSRRAVRTT